MAGKLCVNVKQEMTEKPLLWKKAQSGAYHVDRESSYVFRNNRGDQGDAPFCFGIIWKISGGEKERKGLLIICTVRVILQECFTEVQEGIVSALWPRSNWNRATQQKPAGCFWSRAVLFHSHQQISAQCSFDPAFAKERGSAGKRGG